VSIDIHRTVHLHITIYTDAVSLPTGLSLDRSSTVSHRPTHTQYTVDTSDLQRDPVAWKRARGAMIQRPQLQRKYSGISRESKPSVPHSPRFNNKTDSRQCYTGTTLGGQARRPAQARQRWLQPVQTLVFHSQSTRRRSVRSHPRCRQSDHQ